MRLRRIWFAAVTVATLSVSGCAPAVLKPWPAAWPETWKGRQLYHTPRAYVYASSAVLAGEADRVADEVARDFEQATHRALAKGLLIVCDPKDEPACTDVKALFVAQIRSEYLREKGRPATDVEVEKIWSQVAQVKQVTNGVLADGLSLVPMPVEREFIVSGLGFPEAVAREAGWAVLLPSEAMIRKMMHKMLNAAMDQGKMGIGERILVAPIFAFIEPRMVMMVALTRKAVVFQMVVGQQSDWSPEQRARVSKAYQDGKLKPASDAVMAEIKTKIPAPASRPASAPASEPYPEPPPPATPAPSPVS